MSPYIFIVGVRFSCTELVKCIKHAKAFKSMLKVKCYSDYKVNQRPVSFTINNREFVVEEILDQWYGPGCLYFKVRDNNKDTYILKYNEPQHLWELEFFKKEKK